MKKFLLVTNLISLALLAAFILRIHDVQSKATSMHERQQNVSTCNRCTEKIITISLNEDEYFRFYDFFSDTVVFHFTSGVQKSILQEEKESNWKILQKRFGGTDFVVIDNDNKRYPLAERHPNAVHHYTIMNHNRVYVVGVTQCSLICFVEEIELPHSGPPIPGE